MGLRISCPSGHQRTGEGANTAAPAQQRDRLQASSALINIEEGNRAVRRGNSLLGALGVTLIADDNRKRWVQDTKELQLASTTICRECRHAVRFYVKVSASTPDFVWASKPQGYDQGCRSGGDGGGGERRAAAQRVPAIKIKTMEWRRRASALFGGALRLRSGLEELGFVNWNCSEPHDSMELSDRPKHLPLGDYFNGTANSFEWPASLKMIEFSTKFDEDLRGVVWPTGLKKLGFAGVSFLPERKQLLHSKILKWRFPTIYWPADPFGPQVSDGFNQTLVGVTFPAGLEQLEFSRAFNQPITGVAWPERLKELTFGLSFDQSVQGTAWPPGLKTLVFDAAFNQPVDGVEWPDSLRKLSFGAAFKQPIGRVAWPRRLEELSLGEFFDQDLVRVSVSAGFEMRTPEGLFNRPLRRIAFPTTLKRLCLRGDWFNQPIDGVVWPLQLDELCLSYKFNQEVKGVVWPTKLRKLCLGGRFNCQVEGMHLPSSLKELDMGIRFNQPVEGLVLPAGLEAISFGPAFNQPIENLVWPNSIMTLELHGAFHQPIARVKWPSSLEVLTVEDRFVGRFGLGVWPGDRYLWPCGLKQVVVVSDSEIYVAEVRVAEMSFITRLVTGVWTRGAKNLVVVSDTVILVNDVRVLDEIAGDI